MIRTAINHPDARHMEDTAHDGFLTILRSSKQRGRANVGGLAVVVSRIGRRASGVVFAVRVKDAFGKVLARFEMDESDA
ncbi:hypothetical protein [Rhizobium sp. LCM 4573]|uniref:hypothetical protein n=1 Tax=Rhizobium sp. LCM 4573 TaxID=1848291 RepID=UPI0008DB2862|nr:hypothetical protein [Rhizobium sp. LCM 4573]OHV78259.1 hypothetical protein LCM4573_26890 [Rhizobium sp. LCM 4573]